MADTKQAACMRRLVARWRASDESGASFARRHGVTPWTFWYWQRKLAEATFETRAADAVPLVPVQVVPDAAGDAVEIVLTTGDRVRVGAGASADVVRTVLAALRSA